MKLAKAESLEKQQAAAISTIEHSDDIEDETALSYERAVVSAFDDNLHCFVFGFDFGVAPQMLLVDILDEVRGNGEEASVRKLCLALGNVADGTIPADVLMRLMVMLYASGHPSHDPELPLSEKK